MKKMRFIFVLFIPSFLFFSCNNPTEGVKEKETIKKEELTPEQEKDFKEEYQAVMKRKRKTPCSISDFLELRDSLLQKEFFTELEKVLQEQFPDNKRESEIFVELTPGLLDQFLSDLESTSLEESNTFSQKYHFNIAPATFVDHEKCKDVISLEFFKEDCDFKLGINNSFLDGEGGCTESMVYYVFKINNNKIIGFYRNAAG